MKNSITYTVEKNEKFGDYRINQYIDGVWNNARDNNWSKGQATAILDAINNGEVDFDFCDMSEDFCNTGTHNL